MHNAPKPPVIVALDFANPMRALALADRLDPARCALKVGKEMFVVAGPEPVRWMVARGFKVFLDLKFHDIPNTVAGGVRNAARMGARLVTVHAAGGSAMLDAAVQAVGDSCGILAVTVLTSLDAPEVAAAWGRTDSLNVSAEVVRLAELSAAAGAHGVVCSGREAAAVRRRFGADLAVLVPGVRQAGGAAQDQARVVTPREAADAGARYVVVGRMVTAAPDRCAAMEQVLRDLA